MDVQFAPSTDRRVQLFASRQVLAAFSGFEHLVAAVHVHVRQGAASECLCRLHLTLRPGGSFSVDVSAQRMHEAVERAVERAWGVLYAESARALAAVGDSVAA